MLVAGLTACEKTVVLDLKDAAPKLVIEGQVTDQPGNQYVKVSRSTNFYSTGKSPRVATATVMIEDDLGNSIAFVHNPHDHVDSAGYYFPQTAFQGEIGRTYTLTVVADGQTYEARDKMYSIPPFHKLEYRLDEDEQDDPEDPGRFYEVLYSVKEPQETKDYYLFKCYRNGALEYGSDTDVYFADDELVGENIDGAPMPIYFAANDRAKAEAYSLSRDAFIYYRDLQKILNNDGGMFSPPAATPRTNLSNGALGFFQVSAISSAEIVVGE